jgi:long-chain acyl-CoA synthetase
VPRIFEKIYGRILSGVDDGGVLKKKLFNWALGVGSQVSRYKRDHQSVPVALGLQYSLAYKLVFSKINERLGGRLRFLVSGGAPLSKEISEFFHAAGILILEGYGLTETTAAIFVNTPYKYRFGSVGPALGDTKIKFAADGEILVKGKKIFKEYFKNTEATTESLNDGWFQTGDIGELDNDGFLKITDRKKDLIKTAGGKIVAPQKLENLLKMNPLISQVLIYGDKMKYLVALVTLNQEEVKKFLEAQGLGDCTYKEMVSKPQVYDRVHDAIKEKNSTLASFETIKNFAILSEDFTVESGDLTPSLKVKRKYLSQKYSTVIDGLYD